MRQVRSAVHVVVCALAVTAALCPQTALAKKSYADKSFSVRLPPAFIRFREVAAMGGETVANRFSSAINPAAADWTPMAPRRLAISPYWTRICFQEGTRLDVYGETVVLDLGDGGVLTPTLSQIRSTEGTLRSGLDFKYKVDTVQLQWAKRWGNVAFGALFNYTEAEVIHRLGDLTISKSDAESYRVRLGGLAELAPKWLLGVAFEYGWAPYDADLLTFTQMGPVTVHDKGRAHQVVLRPGLSFEYMPGSSLYVDYQFGYFLAPGDHLHSHRFTMGVDQRVSEFLWLRASVSIDVRGHAGVSLGGSLHLSEHFSIEFGWQCNMLPELEPDFGASNAVQVVLAARF